MQTRIIIILNCLLCLVKVGHCQTQVNESPIYYQDGKVGINVTNPNAHLLVGSDFGACISGSGGGRGVFGSNLAVCYSGVNNSKLYTPYDHYGGYGFAGMECYWGNITFHA
ncbi:hypothetical protein EYV94_28825, partial [Puteibacter caeruleilacunae]